jgi:hypothetical protein
MLKYQVIISFKVSSELFNHGFISLTVPKINTVTRPSPPKKLKTTKPEVLKDTEEIEWVEEVEEFEELKRKVIPPKSPTKKAAPVVNPTKVVKKTSVFDRLGESNVTSTTPEIQDSPTNATAASKVINRNIKSVSSIQIMKHYI